MKRIGKYLRVGHNVLLNGRLIVVNNSGQTLGAIEYKNTWRQYVYESIDEVFYNHRCLTDIAAYLMELNKTKGAYKVKK